MTEIKKCYSFIFRRYYSDNFFKLMRFNRSDLFFLAAAFVSFLFSVSLWFGVLGPGNRDTGIFVGLWVPSILTLGLYGSSSRGNRTNE